MAGFTRTEWIDQPLEIVFAFVTNPENSSSVMENVEETVVVGNGRLDVGTKLRETRLINGKRQTTELLVTDYQPSQRYAVQVNEHGILVSYRYQFQPEKGGTRIDLEAAVSATGLKKMAVPLVVATMKKFDGNHLTQLKNVLEAQEPI